jgi:pimeloyl-ACP methyl ester carboxylesterase
MSQEEIGKLLAEAAEKLVSGSYFLIGTSMGGTNALWFAYHAPTRVRGIILEGSMAPSVLEDLTRPPISKEQREAMARAVDVTSGAPSFPAPPAHPRKPWATADFFRGQMAKRGAMMRWVETDLAASAAVAKMRELNMPILVLLGSKDAIMKPRQEETCKKELPQSRFVLVDGAEHDIQNTAPEEFVRLIEEFIEGV